MLAASRSLQYSCSWKDVELSWIKINPIKLTSQCTWMNGILVIRHPQAILPFNTRYPGFPNHQLISKLHPLKFNKFQNFKTCHMFKENMTGHSITNPFLTMNFLHSIRIYSQYVAIRTGDCQGTFCSSSQSSSPVALSRFPSACKIDQWWSIQLLSEDIQRKKIKGTVLSQKKTWEALNWWSLDIVYSFIWLWRCWRFGSWSSTFLGVCTAVDDQF